MPQHNPLTPILAANPFMVLDGALATELEARGCNLNNALWSAKVLLDNPQLIYQVHLDYFRAGAQCAISASYQATPAGLAAWGMSEEQASHVISASVALARQARADFLTERPDAGLLLVAGSVGPYGAFLANGAEYRGDYALSPAALRNFHRPRIMSLLNAGADILACETQPSFAEVRVLAPLLREFPAAAAWFSFTLRDDKHLSDGTPLREAISFLRDFPQVVAVGINCIAPRNVLSALMHLQTLTALPLVVYPNAGEHYDADKKVWRRAATAGLLPGQYLAQWAAAGARLIGGCCRTTPQDIAALAAYRNEWPAR